MSQVFDPAWWVTYLPLALPWLIFLLLCQVSMLPICFRVFRLLPDRAVGASFPLGFLIVGAVSWLLSLQWFFEDHRSTFFRLLLLGIASLFFGIGFIAARQPGLNPWQRRTRWFPFVLFTIAGGLYLPFSGFSVYTALFLVLLSGSMVALLDINKFLQDLRRFSGPLILSYLLFFLSFLFFLNVRSYIPYATFELSLYPAEKWGNLTHIGSIMNSSSFPPKDLWFNEYPLNYYYGGHMLTSVAAKASGMPPSYAFNLGLATIFAMTVVSGFSFSTALVQLISRKFRVSRNITWHRGFCWGLFGALAIALFGNLDPWRQFFTRGLDGGVRQRWVHQQELAAGSWKVMTGFSPVSLQDIHNRVKGSELELRISTFESELDQLEVALSKVPERFEQLRDSFQSNASSLSEQDIKQPQKTELYGLVNGPAYTRAWDEQNALNGVVAREKIYHLIQREEFDSVLEVLNEVIENHQVPESDLEIFRALLEKRKAELLDSNDLVLIIEELQSAKQSGSYQALFQNSPERIVSEIIEAKSEKDLQKLLQVLRQYEFTARQYKKDLSSNQLAVLNGMRTILRMGALLPGELFSMYFGQPVPSVNRSPSIEDLRYSWENFSFINFWDSSRAIKSSPPGEKNSGTITEFPYFSAILGDHHPHHYALPFSIVLLTVCLSLLRKNARRRRSEKQFWRSCACELLLIAFLMGSLFPINIWDAVVMSPLVGLVIIISRIGVVPSFEWKWIGFAGYGILVAMVVGIFFNSMPDTTPLFQMFPAFLAGVFILAAGFPLATFVKPEVNRWVLFALSASLSILIVGLGPFLSLGKGTESPTPALTIAIRDVFFFMVIMSLAALWSLRSVPESHLWWYSCGGVYAAVGFLAVLIILPFKLYFESPLQPSREMLASLLPPVLSYELTSAPRFWNAFWAASPVNPFPENLRTEVKDFVMHWGLFVVPIFVLMISRFFKSLKGRPPGFSFMISMAALALIALARNYLGYWVGALCLGGVAYCVYYAVLFRKRSEGAIWVFLSVGFFWCWFVEALHFDDDYAGYLERYNTPFKIYYPLWPIFAGGMVVAVRELFSCASLIKIDPGEVLYKPAFWFVALIGGVILPWGLAYSGLSSIGEPLFILFWIVMIPIVLFLIFTTPNSTYGRNRLSLIASMISSVASRWKALVVSGFILLLGCYYPLASTATRTRGFFSWPIADSYESRLPQEAIFRTRTLDGLHHLREFPKYEDDYWAMKWVSENVAPEQKILERVGDVAYSHIGRISTGGSARTILGWKHHEHQWRGRAKAAPGYLKEDYISRINALPDLNTILSPLVGSQKHQLTSDEQRSLRFAEGDARLQMLAKFYPKATLADLYRMETLISRNDLTVQRVMDQMMADAREIYTTDDEELLEALLIEYAIDYVVVGKLERDEFGSNLDEVMSERGYEKVFTSGIATRSSAGDVTNIYKITWDLSNEQ